MRAENLAPGEQKRLEFGMALSTRPSLQLLDEPAAGRAYLLENGRVTLEGAAQALLANPRLRAAYLGGG